MSRLAEAIKAIDERSLSTGAHEQAVGVDGWAAIYVGFDLPLDDLLGWLGEQQESAVEELSERGEIDGQTVIALIIGALSKGLAVGLMYAELTAKAQQEVSDG